MSSLKSTYKIIVTPFEYIVASALKTIADYITTRAKSRGIEVSDHDIARMFPVLEDYLQGREMKTTAIGRIMEIYARNFGFTNNEERERVEKAVVTIIDKISIIRAKEPTRAFKLVRSLRVLLISLVRGWVTLPIEVYEKEEKQS